MYLALLGPCTPSLSSNMNFPSLRNLRHLSITLHGLCELLLLSIRRSAHSDTLKSVTNLSLHVASGRIASRSTRLPTFTLHLELSTSVQYRYPDPPPKSSTTWPNLNPLANALASIRRFPSSSSRLWELERSGSR